MKASSIDPINPPTNADDRDARLQPTMHPLAPLAERIKSWGLSLGFQQVGITDTELSQAEKSLQQWLDKGYHGTMQFMHKHGLNRTRPDQLVAGTQRVISVRMNYLPQSQQQAKTALTNPIQAYLSRYALGRDYHKVMRRRLQQLADLIEQEVGPFGYRVFVDSAPVMEKALAEKAGLGWIGKHSNLINQQAGSWFFLGELYTDLPLPVDQPQPAYCGHCRACIDICPTQAIVAPYQVDARRCISYLTIELRESIPLALRPLIGNHIYGCDDCLLICPWNRFARLTDEADFMPRHQLDARHLVELFEWDESTFLKNTEGSAIRRIGHQCWLRNIAVALGNSAAPSHALSPGSGNLLNAATRSTIVNALRNRMNDPSGLVREHVEWALERHR